MAQAKAAKRKAAERFQLKVTLLGTRPPVWRRLIVPADATLDEVHWIIQVAMPWQNSHLHQFHDTDRTTRYSDPEFELEEVEDESGVRVRQVLREPKDRITYEYDFGDSWEHLIQLEKILPPRDDGKRRAECAGGKRAAPPDDVGGVWGYADFVEAIQDPDHERHEELLEWIGGEFDPEAFDSAEVNRWLKKALRL